MKSRGHTSSSRWAFVHWPYTPKWKHREVKGKEKGNNKCNAEEDNQGHQRIGTKRYGKPTGRRRSGEEKR